MLRAGELGSADHAQEQAGWLILELLGLFVADDRALVAAARTRPLLVARLDVFVDAPKVVWEPSGAALSGLLGSLLRLFRLGLLGVRRLVDVLRSRRLGVIEPLEQGLVVVRGVALAALLVDLAQQGVVLLFEQLQRGRELVALGAENRNLCSQLVCGQLIRVCLIVRVHHCSRLTSQTRPVDPGVSTFSRISSSASPR